MIRKNIILFICLSGMFLMTGCVEHYPEALIQSWISFSYPDERGDDKISEQGRIAYIDYYIFDSHDMLYAKHRVDDGQYKDVIADLPEGKISIVAWANFSGNDLLYAGTDITLDEWRVKLAKSQEQFDLSSGTLYQGIASRYITRTDRKIDVKLSHRHANLLVKLQGEGVVSNAQYECELVTGENIYLFKEGVKELTSNKSIMRESFIPMSTEGNGKTTIFRTYRLFYEEDKDATIEVFKEGSSIIKTGLKELVQEEELDIYNLYEQNIVIYIHIDKNDIISVSIKGTDWEVGEDGSIGV